MPLGTDNYQITGQPSERALKTYTADITVPYTRTVIPQSVKVKVGSVVVGHVQSIEFNQNRPVNQSYEIGSTGVQDQQPQQPEYTGTITKLKVYGWNLLRTLMLNSNEETEVRAFLSDIQSAESINENVVFMKIVHNMYPFDMKVQEKDPLGNTVTYTVAECFVENANFTAGVGDPMLTETCGFKYRNLIPDYAAA